MDNQKPLQFEAGALDYFILTILSVLLIYIPFLGWAVLLNYSGSWFADRALVTGKKITFKAAFGESLKFVFVNFLLLIVTLGIYSFWFYPKLYKYMVDHVHFADEVPAPLEAEPVTAAPVESPSSAQNETFNAPAVSEPQVTTPEVPAAPEQPVEVVTPVSEEQNPQNPQA